MNECAKENANNKEVIQNSAQKIIGAAAVYLLRHARGVTPLTLYTVILTWERQSRTTPEKTVCRQALALLSHKLN